MRAISINFTFTGDLFTDEWPHPGNDYGYITYNFGNKHYKDSSGYLSSFVWNLLDGLANKFQNNEKYYVTSLDGDKGLILVPSKEEVEVRICAGTRMIYVAKIARKEFIKFCFETADRFFDSALKINPKLK